MNRSPSCVSFILVMAVMLGVVALRDQQVVASPQASQTVTHGPKAQALYCALWRVDKGFVSTIRVKNVLVIRPLLVSPVLFMADGTEYDLAPVDLAPGGIGNININQALDSAPSKIRGHLSNYGSVVLRFSSKAGGNATATLQILNVPESLIFTMPFGGKSGRMATSGGQTVEALWWKHDAGVKGFVGVTNTTNASEAVNVQVIGSAGTIASRTVTLGGNQTQLVDLDPMLQELPSPETMQGGVRIQYQGKPQDIIATGGLMNEQEGYSADMKFFSRMAMADAPAVTSYASAGIMVGAPDPAMNFPPGTRFSPYAVLRNSSNDLLQVTPMAYVMTGTSSRQFTLPIQSLAPNESRQLPLDAMLAAAGLNDYDGDMTLDFTYQGHPEDLFLSTGSVDQKGTYVFQVTPEGMGESWAKIVPLWSVANGSDTMITAWNSGNTAEDLIVTLTYSGGTGHYTIPLHLEAGASQMIALGMLITQQQPDAQGNIIPRTVQEGSARFENSKGRTEPIHLVLSTGIFNVQTATCGNQCQICDAATDLTIDQNPITTPSGLSVQATSTLTMTDGTTQDVTTTSNWSSANTSIATVKTRGQSSPGRVNGVAPGSTTISAALIAVDGTEPLPPCAYICPTTGFNGSSPGNVTPNIAISGPNALPLGTDVRSIDLTANGNPSGGTYSWRSSSTKIGLQNPTSSIVTVVSVVQSNQPNDVIVTVDYTMNGQTKSASTNLTVQKPSSLSIVPGTSSTTAESSCSFGNPPQAGCGVTRTFLYQVNDQFTHPILFAGMQFWDSITSGRTNGCNLTGYQTTCTDLGKPNGGPCGPSTSAAGQLEEELGICSSTCRLASGVCTTGCNTIAIQTWHINGTTLPTINPSYQCDQVLVNG
jgi:hypothetical protein